MKKKFLLISGFLLISLIVTIFAAGGDPPTFSNPSNTSDTFSKGSTVTIQITVTDPAMQAIVEAKFHTNFSGTWEESFNQAAGDQNEETYSMGDTIDVSAGTEVCWYMSAITVSAGSNSSNTYCFTVQNNVPALNSIELNSSLGNNHSSEDLTCWINATDGDGGNVSYNYQWLLNGTPYIWNSTFDPTFMVGGIAIDSNDTIYSTGYTDLGAFNYAWVTNAFYTNGTKKWNATWDNASEMDLSSDLAVYQDKVYVTGTSNYLFIAVYNSSGDNIKNISRTDSTSVSGIAIDSSGNPITSGRLGTSPDYMWEVIKFNYTSGNVLWNTTWDIASNSDSTKDIKIDSSGDAYVVGSSNSSNYEMVLKKYNGTNGSVIWSTTFDTTVNDTSEELALDSSGNIYVSGSESSANFGGGTNNMTLIKFNSSGDHQWNVTYDHGGDEIARAIEVDSNYVYIGGDSIFLMYDNSGNHIWNYTTDVNSIEGIVIGSDGYNYLADGGSNQITKLSPSNMSDNYTQGTLANVSTLESSYTSIGENWSCKVRPYDGTNYGTYNFSDNLTILPSVPVMITASINSSSESNYSFENLLCWANATDTEAHNLTYNGYWYKDGVQNISFNTTPLDYTPGTLVNVATLTYGNTSIGDKWACKIRAYDGYSYSTDYNFSGNLTIVSVPQETNTGSGGGGNAYFRYTLTNNDLSQGYEKSFRPRTKINIPINNVTHSLTLNKIEANQVIIIIESVPKTISLGINETILIDVDDDGTDDISVKLKEISKTYYTSALLEVKKAEPVEETPQEEPATEKGIIPHMDEPESSYTLLITIIVIMCLIYIIYSRVNKRKSRKR